MTKIFDILGYYGPIILFVFVFLQIKTTYYATVFTIGFVLNYLLNEALKITIKEPRPDNPVPYDFIKGLNRSKTGSRGYGMPSGHVQTAMFSAVFYAFYRIFNNTYSNSLENAIYVISVFWLVFITAYQRVKYRRHTVLQTMYGAIIGSIFAYIVYTFSKKSGV